MVKYVDTSWDFRSEDTKTSTHSFHNYPAMMIPQIAGRLIAKYGAGADHLLDPYCGSGTALVEANMAGINAYGIDINPLARLIAEVKTTAIDPAILKTTLTNISNTLYLYSFKSEMDVAVPNFFNMDYWFSPKVSEKLALIKREIDLIESPQIRNFFLLPFSETVRASSYTRSGEFKLFRMPPKKLQDFDPDVWGIFLSKANRNIDGMKSFWKKHTDASVRILNEDSRHKTSIEDGKIDIIVTSPPYGDSQTTVAYGQFSRLSLQWIGFDDEIVRKIDKISLGGKIAPDIEDNLASPSLKHSLEQIAEKDRKRARQVLSFYIDLDLSLKEFGRALRKGGVGCFVVGNRTVKNVQLPTDEVLVEMASKFDCEHIETIIRNIPNKRMPSMNSPTNITGELGATMTKEYIVVLEKN